MTYKTVANSCARQYRENIPWPARGFASNWPLWRRAGWPERHLPQTTNTLECFSTGVLIDGGRGGDSPVSLLTRDDGASNLISGPLESDPRERHFALGFRNDAE